MDEGEHQTCMWPMHKIMYAAHLQGAKEKRLEGDEHMAVVEEFVMAVSKRHPHALIQFEDFQTGPRLCHSQALQGQGVVLQRWAGLQSGSRQHGVCRPATDVCALDMRHFT